MTLLIMAAGLGSRYGGVKQIDPVGPNGELIIDYSIYDAIAAGFSRVVFVIRREIEQDFREAIFDRIAGLGKIECEYVFQEMHDLPAGFSVPPVRTKPWGTGHAPLAARRVIAEPFCVVNADEFYGRAAYEKMARFFADLPKGSEGVYAFVTARLENAISDYGTVSRGVCETDADGNITEINERLRVFRRGGQIGYTLDGNDFYPLRSDAEVNVNFSGFTPDFFPLLWEKFEKFLGANCEIAGAEFGLPQTVSELMNQGTITLKSLGSSDDWLSITNRQDKSAVQTAIAEKIAHGEYPAPLWA